MINIEWDEKKCPTPRDCRKCLELCPQGVFVTYGRGGRQPGKKEEDWVIAPGWIFLCDGCKVCEEICPQDAIKVNVKA